MNELTLQNILKIAEERNIELGDKPENTIKKYINLGLLPKPVRKKKKEGKGTQLFYADNTIEKLAHVKALKSEGLSLEEIRDSFAIMYVKNALTDLFDEADDEKVKQLAQMIGGKEKELESIVEAPLVYMIQGMSSKEAKKLLTLFCGVGFYSMLEAQQELENFNFNNARKALFKAIFYNSIAMLRMARTTGDETLEKTAEEVYEKMVLEPISKASKLIRSEFVSSIEKYLEEKGFDKSE
ncbi:MAG: MerR family transcriptional regulator [Candidatus Dadabacteria bacterium]|nr:MerR family transcriptional regulator [Candidatus Dadabacteria bacterium]NIQ13664.1 MerR family transcriptional regulator [Candidatus Dadabacteria bacterium]